MDKLVYLIFGGTGGIGSALTRVLLRDSDVVVAARGQERLDELASGANVAIFRADATSFEEAGAAVEFARGRFSRLDGVVNCAGSILLKGAHQTSEAEWQSVLATNLTSAFSVVRAAAKAMMQSGGSIVLMSTAAARTGLANHDAIAAAKAGVIGLTMSAAATYGKQNIRVNCVAPGLVRTPLSARITGNEASLKASEAMHALGRIGEPDEVAETVAHVLRSPWMTGQIIGVDGGLSTVRPR